MSKKLTVVTDLIILLLLLFLASQLFLVVDSYIAASNFWLNILTAVVAILLGLVGAKAAVKTRFSLLSLNMINLVGLGILLWLINHKPESNLLFLIALIILIIYSLAVSFVSRYEYLKFDFLNLDKTRLEKQGLNFKRQGIILKGVKNNLIMIDLLAVISWLAAKKINLVLIVSGIALLICQYLLWQFFKFSIKALNWFLADYKVDFKIFNRCFSWSVLLIIIVLVLSLLVPVQYGNNFAELIANKLDNWEEEVNLEREYDLGQLSNIMSGKRAAQRNFNVETKDLPWYWSIPAVISLVAVVFSILGAITILFLIFKRKADEFKKLPRLVVNLYKTLFALFKNWRDLFVGEMKQIKKNFHSDEQNIEKENEFQRRKGLSSLERNKVSNLLEELIKLLESKGYKRENYETLEEFFHEIKRDFSTLEEELTWSQKIINKVSYSQVEIKEQTRDKLKKLIEELENKE
ncbi:hypothetical protein JOC47_002238 [Halanaerobacter jeridensis]|uniref:DUF4129 domain-containing protein n=1 Tax=Halanaerobacter jeridensis TaxID=706427 RepID=A0A938XXB7_9FIRM|nr:hypothetical protein [Halanaerobacter jeridensis]